jgi:hypothetical protein
VLFFRVGHDPALGLIYAPVLGAWFFPIVISGASLVGIGVAKASPWGLMTAGIAAAVFLEEFLRLDGVWKRTWKRIQLVSKGGSLRVGKVDNPS